LDLLNHYQASIHLIVFEQLEYRFENILTVCYQEGSVVKIGL